MGPPPPAVVFPLLRLRPEFQCPDGTAGTQTETIDVGETTPAKAVTAKKQPWPKALAEQAQAIRSALEGCAAPATAEQVARGFQRARTERVAELLDTLASLGQCRRTPDGRFVL